ncbi:MAG: RHS repeat-associated core domain-containing protein, partial [bacterium]
MMSKQFIRRLVLFSSCVVTVCSASAGPDWWITRDVVVTNGVPNDYAPVLQGQIRWLATNACRELEAKLPGGAGNEVRVSVAMPVENPQTPVNIGQMKQASVAILARLITEGVVAGYPWASGETNDFSPVNIGQAKQVFSFTLEPVEIDSDGEGIPDWLERDLGLDPDCPLDGKADADDDGLSLADELAIGSNPGNGDSDGDGMGDGAEMINGFSPTNTDSLARLPFVESFERPGVTNGMLAGQGRWRQGTGAVAQVVGAPVIAGIQSLCLRATTNEGPAISHPLATHGAGAVWIDYLCVPVWRLASAPEGSATGCGSAFYVNRLGQVVVFDRSWLPGEWVTLTNAPLLQAGVAARFTLQQDYLSQRWGLWLNGTNIMAGLPFAADVHELAGIRFAGARYSDTLLDQIAVTTNAPPGLVPDSDGDGLPDDWERTLGLDPYDPADSDCDHDGLTNLQEYQLGLDPKSPDTDHDGWNDGVELALGTSPTQADFTVTAPLPFLDPFEMPGIALGELRGQNRWQASLTNWAVVQSDNHTEGSQALQLMPDMSGQGVLSQAIRGFQDGLVWSDFRAIPVRRLAASRPVLHPATTASFFIDAAGYPVVASGTNWITLTNAPVIVGTNWCRVTVMQDFSNQVWSLYYEGVPLVRGLKFVHGLTQFTGLRISGGHASSFLDDIRVTTNAPGDIDTEGDGLPNDWELTHGLDPESSSDLSDPDHDGLSNLEEYRLGLDPQTPDTDGDGMSDGAEFARGYSSTNPGAFRALPFAESFESPAVTNGGLAGQNGWTVVSSNNSTRVWTNRVFSGVQALQFGGATSDVAILHPLATLGKPVVWTDLRCVPVFRNDPVNPVLSEASTIGFYVNGAGHVVVRDGDDWVSLTNHLSLTTNAWVRFTTCQDFSNQVWSLALDGKQLGTGLCFARPALDYSGFLAKGSPTRTALLDAITVSTNPPPDIDSDGDGMPDDWEVLHGLNHPFDPAVSVDPDHDGLSNLEEYLLGTDPRVADSDEDGMGDQAEYLMGASAVLSNSYFRLPFEEGFEVPGVTNGALGGQRGWVATGGGSVLVQTQVVWNGGQALKVAATSSVSHGVAATGASVVWLDVQARPVPRLQEDPPVIHSNSASAFFFDAGGHLSVCVNDQNHQYWYALAQHSPVSTSQWIRLTVRQDYGARRWAIWLDGTRVAEGLPFANPVSEFSEFRVGGPAFSSAYLDNLVVSTNEPSGLDNDGDGLPNSWELAFGLNPDLADSLADPDLDGLTHLEEYHAGLDPLDPDTDQDGLVDGHGGVMPLGLFPAGVDQDGDGYADGEFDYGCDPLRDDTDGDGLTDGMEAAAGLNPGEMTLGQGLVAWYRFDETNGTGIVDSSGNGHDGNWVGTGRPSGIPGPMGRALEFDGLTNGVVISGLPVIAANMSLTAWVCQEAAVTNPVQVIVAREGAFSLVLNQRHPELRIPGAVPVTLVSTSTIPASAWTHLGVVVGESNIALSVNGSIVSETNRSVLLPSVAVPLGIGFNASLTNDWFAEGLDDIRLYSRSLRASELQELYLLGADPDGDGLPVSTASSTFGASIGSLARDLDGDGVLTTADRDRLASLAAEMSGNVTRLYYDEEGNLIRKVDALGNETAMTYDGNNRPLTVTDANHHTTSNEINALGAVAAATDALGNVSRFDYDAFGEVTNVTDAAGNQTRMEYNLAGQVVRTVNARGVARVTMYDALGRVQCLVEAVGTADEQKMWSFYDAADNLVSNRNALGVVGEFGYDARGLMVRQGAAKGTAVEAVEETDYDSRGLAVGHKDALNHWTYQSYDALSRPVSGTDALGNTSRTEYDNRGHVVAAVYPSGRTVRSEFDRWGRMIRVRDGADAATTDYDVLDRVVVQADWRGIRSETAYDSVGNVTNSLAAAGTPEQAGTATFHDAANRPVRKVNANSVPVLSTYDALGNKVALTDGLGHTTRWVYGQGNRLEGVVRPDGTVVSNGYDSLDRVVEVRVDGTVRQQFAYDGLSRMTHAVDYNQPGAGDDHRVAYEYDALNRVTGEAQDGRRIERVFDAAGHATRLTYPSGFVLKRAFNAKGQLAALQNEAGTVTYAAYAYTPNSRIQAITYGSGVVETHGLDSRDRLRTLVQQGARCDFSATLARDPGGNVTHCSESADEGAIFQYDALNRVTAQKNMTALFRETLRYDAMGNWLCHSNPAQGAVTRDVNQGNQYSRIGAQALQYDVNGSLTNWGGREFSYDFLGRLIEVKSNGVTLAGYSYDGRNRRVAKDAGGVHTAYYYDGESLIDVSVGGGWGRITIYGETLDTPVVFLRAGIPLYYLRDWRANIAVMTDAAGQPVERYRYSLFGQMEVMDGYGNPLTGSLTGNIWTFAGRQWDAETGLMHNRNRAYSAELGRFLQADPAGYADGMNLYAYAGNNPLLFSDPYGLYRWSHGALDERIGEWIFRQYDQLREIERQRREYEEALRRAEEERQRIQRENEYAARAFNQYKAEHAHEIRDMANRYEHLGVNEDEAARLLMSGITSIPRLGATVGPNDTRRGWWLDYYLRGGRINDVMRGEMGAMGSRSVDEFFAKTSQKETALREKRKGTQQQYTLAAVAIVATVVTCGAGGVLGAALLGTVGVSATTVSFGAFVAGAVAIQGVAAAASTVISHGSIGD